MELARQEDAERNGKGRVLGAQNNAGNGANFVSSCLVAREKWRARVWLAGNYDRENLCARAARPPVFLPSRIYASPSSIKARIENFTPRRGFQRRCGFLFLLLLLCFFVRVRVQSTLLRLLEL